MNMPRSRGPMLLNNSGRKGPYLLKTDIALHHEGQIPTGVERIPAEWVDDVRRRVDAGREFKQAVAEVLAANAQLLVLERQQTGR